jgi:hypothetical protein
MWAYAMSICSATLGRAFNVPKVVDLCVAVVGRVQTLGLEPVDPLVVGEPRDLVSVTQIAHRPLATRVVSIEMLTLLLRVRFHPRHPLV